MKGLTRRHYIPPSDHRGEPKSSARGNPPTTRRRDRFALFSPLSFFALFYLSSVHPPADNEECKASHRVARLPDSTDAGESKRGTVSQGVIVDVSRSPSGTICRVAKRARKLERPASRLSLHFLYLFSTSYTDRTPTHTRADCHSLSFLSILILLTPLEFSFPPFLPFNLHLSYVYVHTYVYFPIHRYTLYIGGYAQHKVLTQEESA